MSQVRVRSLDANLGVTAPRMRVVLAQPMQRRRNGWSIQHPAESGRGDRDSRAPFAVLGFHNDFDILSERHQEAHQPLHGEPFQLVMQQSGDLRLVDFERHCDFGLGKPAPFHDPIDGS